MGGADILFGEVGNSLSELILGHLQFYCEIFKD